MKTLIGLAARCQNGTVSIKMFFDSREEMPSLKVIKEILKNHMNNIKEFSLIDPLKDLKGDFLGNYFDIISYKGNHSYLDFETKVLYENKQLLKDFKKNPINIWKDKEQEEFYKKVQSNREFAEVLELNRRISEKIMQNEV